MKIIDLNKIRNIRKYTVASLFAGAGGLDMGLELAGFKTVWANDIDKDACATCRLWSQADVVQGDIAKIDYSDVPDTDVITGGFPCQGFSLAGPRKINDERNKLYRYFVKLVELKQPYAFIAENVKGILTLGDGEIIEAIIEDFASKGYDVYHNLVNAADYGVPQDRWRVILYGFRKDLEVKDFKFPEPFPYKVTLREAIRDMPEPKQSDICHASYSSRYMSRNRKRGWDEVSYTIPAMAKQVPLHPSSPDMIKIGEDKWIFGEGKTRRFSWQEAAVIQTFPRDMEFVGNLTSKYRQIGNAVPVKLAEVVGKKLYEILEEKLNANVKELEQKVGE
jgi:DNA (cytosine-5)-methyltransferase 1